MISELAELIEHNADFIWEVDKDAKYTYVNSVAKELLGYEPKELIGKTPYDFMVPKDRMKIEIQFLEIIKNKKKFKDLENVNIRKDGKEIVLETSGVPILDKDGELIGYRGIDRDITEKVLLRNELENKNKLLEELIQTQSKMATMGEMVAGITQQLRRPLNQINTVASGIRLQKELGIFDEDKLDELLQKIEYNIEFLSQTVGEFRDFFSANQAELFFDLKVSIKKALLLLNPEFKDLRIKVKKDLSNIEVKGFENLLLQVLINIIKNAKDALSENKTETKKLLFLKNSEDEKSIYITIRDNAGGIEKDALKNIFKPSFSTNKINGTGLGLYMSKTIMRKRLNGELLVENVIYEYKNKPYRGAEFTIVLNK